LKKAYGRQVEQLIRLGIHHITKVDFLPAFKAAHQSSITSSNIRASFQAAGLVPHDPDVVLLKLDVKLRTPSPPLPTTTWVSKTPSNAAELEAQSTH
jgi:hypothetical protein